MLGDLFRQPRRFRWQIDHAFKRQRDGGVIKHERHRTLRRLGCAGRVFQSRHAIDQVLIAFKPRFGDRIRANQQQRDFCRWRHVQLRACRAGLSDKVHHPVNFGFGLRVDQVRREFRPLLNNEHAGALLAEVPQPRPKLLGDEGHERVQHDQDLIERPRRGAPRFRLRGFILAIEQWLDEFEIPIAIDIPNEFVERTSCLVKAPRFQFTRDIRRAFRGLADDPLVHELLWACWIELIPHRAFIHLRETRGVPELGAEIAIAFDALFAEFDVAPLRRHRRQSEAQGISAKLIDELQGVHGIALGLRHLGAGGVTHQSVDIDLVERHFFHEVHAEHHHPRHPEEDDVVRGDEC